MPKENNAPIKIFAFPPPPPLFDANSIYVISQFNNGERFWFYRYNFNSDDYYWFTEGWRDKSGWESFIDFSSTTFTSGQAIVGYWRFIEENRKYKIQNMDGQPDDHGGAGLQQASSTAFEIVVLEENSKSKNVSIKVLGKKVVDINTDDFIEVDNEDTDIENS